MQLMYIYYVHEKPFKLQFAPSKDKLEVNVFHTLAVIEHAAVLGLQSALQFVLLMDVSVQLEQS